MVNMISDKKSIAVINKSDEKKAINDEIFAQKNIQRVYLQLKTMRELKICSVLLRLN